MSFFTKIFGRPEKAGGFLCSLSQKKRVAVSNLNPLIYQTIIQERKGEKAPTIVSAEGAFDEDGLAVLRTLSISELETLSESVQEGQQGDACAGCGDFSDAASHYRKACELNPHNDLAIMSYGCALAHQGELQEGIQCVKKALRVNPRNERAKSNLKGTKAEL